MSNLHPLETTVQHSRFIAVVRRELNLSAYSREDSDPIARCAELEVSTCSFPRSILTGVNVFSPTYCLRRGSKLLLVSKY